MEKVTAKIRKIQKARKLRERSFFVLMVLLVVIGIIGVIVTSVKGEFDYLPVFCIIGFLVPVVLFVLAMIGIVKIDDGSQEIKKIVLESSLSADEIMSVGEKLNINLFSLALAVRCKELGLSSVPEWCVRDGVLPTKKEV